MNRLIALIPMLFALSVAGCAKSPEDELVGRWYHTNSPLEVEFFSDGTIVFDGDERVAGDFTVLDESNIRFDLGGTAATTGPLVVGYEIQGDSLLLDEPNGDDVTTFSREDLGAVRFAPGQVLEGRYLSAGARAAVTEFYLELGEWPDTNWDAGIMEATEIYGRYVESVTVENGIVIARFGRQSHESVYGKELVMTPSVHGGSVSWTCSSTSIDFEYLPAACR
ncbi:MAG: pilin [Woeseiaceae bacterium]|nr:pilin [Woeseiaceae bacterium]